MKSLNALLFLVIFSCQNSELIQREYPLVVTHDILEEAESSILVRGQLLESRSRISEHGFIWGFASDLIGVDTVYLGPLTTGKLEFQYTFSNVFSSNKNYFVKAFVQTETFKVYGNHVSFNCIGCNPPLPVINSITPTAIREKGIVLVKGQNFLFENPQVFYGNVECDVNTITETEFTFTVPSQKAVTFDSRSELISLQKKYEFGLKAVSKSPLILQEPWLRLPNTRKFQTSDKLAFSHNNRVYFLVGRNLFYSDYDTREKIYVSQVPELYDSFSCSIKYLNKWYVTFFNNYLSQSYIWEYDIVNDLWKKLPDVPATGYYSSLIASNNTLFLIDNFYGNQKLKLNLNDLSWGTHIINFSEFTHSPKIVNTTNTVFAISNNQIAVFNSDNEEWEIIHNGIFPVVYVFWIGDKIYMGDKSKLLELSIDSRTLRDRSDKISSFPSYIIQGSNSSDIEFIINMESRGFFQSTQVWDFNPAYFQE